MSGRKKGVIKKKRISIYLPNTYAKRAEDGGNVSEYYRRASDAYELQSDSVFLPDYKFLAKYLHKNISYMNGLYQQGKLSRQEEALLEIQQDAFLALMKHDWWQDIEEM